jgi:hypothetical protein
MREGVAIDVPTATERGVVPPSVQEIDLVSGRTRADGCGANPRFGYYLTAAGAARSTILQHGPRTARVGRINSRPMRWVIALIG